MCVFLHSLPSPLLPRMEKYGTVKEGMTFKSKPEAGQCTAPGNRTSLSCKFHKALKKRRAGGVQRLCALLKSSKLSCIRHSLIPHEIIQPSADPFAALPRPAGVPCAIQFCRISLLRASADMSLLDFEASRFGHSSGIVVKPLFVSRQHCLSCCCC